MSKTIIREDWGLTPEIQKNVLNPNRPVKDFDDVIELGMYGAYELGNHDDFKFLEQFKDIEMGLEENPAFTKLAHSMSVLRQEVIKGTGMLELVKVNEALQNNQTYKSILDGQNKLREQAFKIAQPNQEFPDAIQRIAQITESHQQYHIEEQERMQLEVAKSEMDMYKTELEQVSVLVKKADAVFVSDFYKQHQKDIQQHIDRATTKPKTGEGEDTKQIKAHIVELFENYASMKVGKKIADEVGDEDKRKRRYTNAECYNLINANYYPKLKTSTIEEYIRKHKK